MNWYEIKNEREIASPALLVYPDRIASNIDSMFSLAGTPDRLRPHVKTYKMPQIVEMQMERGIKKFKCATIVEAQMLVKAGVKDILLAMPTVGPNQRAFLELKRQNHEIQFSALIDSESQISIWKSQLNENETLDLFIDINVGMSRTGIAPDRAEGLIHQLEKDAAFQLKGLHVYDGHNRIEDAAKRASQVESEYDGVKNLLSKIDPTDQLEVVCGGSVTFPCHASDKRRTVSPGTTLLWDAGYGSRFPDVPMENAAVLLTRIISMPGDDRICLDLGHKSVASEMSGQRVIFPQLTDYERVGHSEEHLVLKLKDRTSLKVGQVLYGIPWHICPTVALHAQVGVVENHEVKKFWDVVARHRVYQLA